MSQRIVQRSRRRAHWLSLVYGLLAVGVACKKNDGETAPGGYVQAGIGQPAGAAGALATAGAPAAGGAAQAGAPALAGGGGFAGTATAAAGAAGAAGGAAFPQRLDATAGAAIQPLLNELAKKETQPGSKPIGQTLVGNFQQGQSLDVPIQLTPNKCYTVVAASLGAVTEVNIQLQLVTPIPGAAPVLAIDQDSGPSAVLGKKTACYRWMLGVIPAPAKVVVQVAGGSGLVVAQAYEK
ncbi:MAG TPA: hypothetical protein VGK73_12355 [Polyangiaceae bacterium]